MPGLFPGIPGHDGIAGAAGSPGCDICGITACGAGRGDRGGHPGSRKISDSGNCTVRQPVIGSTLDEFCLPVGRPGAGGKVRTVFWQEDVYLFQRDPAGGPGGHGSAGPVQEGRAGHAAEYHGGAVPECAECAGAGGNLCGNHGGGRCLLHMASGDRPGWCCPQPAGTDLQGEDNGEGKAQTEYSQAQGAVSVGVIYQERGSEGNAYHGFCCLLEAEMEQRERSPGEGTPGSGIENAWEGNALRLCGEPVLCLEHCSDPVLYGKRADLCGSLCGLSDGFCKFPGQSSEPGGCHQ